MHECEAFRNQFAQDGREIRDADDDDGERDSLAMQDHPLVGKPLKRRFEVIGHAFAAERRREGADQRNTHLNRGEKPIWIGSQLDRQLRTVISRFRLLLQATASGSDNGDFGPGKEAVGQDQDQDNKQFCHKAVAHVNDLLTQ